MYTDRDYQIKDRFRENVPQGSIRTLYRSSTVLHARNRESRADPGLYPATSLREINPIPHYPPGLEILADLNKLYLIKRLEILESDTMGKYTAEIIDEEGTRIFLITPSTHYDSDEVIQYGKLKKLKMKGKICFGVINYAGVQVFEIYGDPEKVIRIGPNSAVWGEIQMIPNPVLARIPLFYCFFKQHRKDMEDAMTEVRVVILKKDLGEKNGPYHQKLPSFKNVYTLRGKVYGGCCRTQDSTLYKKSFDLYIFAHDPFEKKRKVAEDMPEKTSSGSIGRIGSNEQDEKLDSDLPLPETVGDPTGKGADGGAMPKNTPSKCIRRIDSTPPPLECPQEKQTHSKCIGRNLPQETVGAPDGGLSLQGFPQETVGEDAAAEPAKPKKPPIKSIGRICSNSHHDKLNIDLPMLQFPHSLDLYDKITLMGTFFLFNLT